MAEYKIARESEEAAEGETPVYVHPEVMRHGKQLLKSVRGITTIYKALEAAETEPGDDRYLGRITDNKEIEYYTYQDIRGMARAFCRSLCSIGVRPKDIIGIYSNNRPEWIIAEHAGYFMSCINCPLYDSLGKKAVQHILHETEMHTIVLSGHKAENLLPIILRAEGEHPEFAHRLKRVISMDKISEDLEDKYRDLGIKVYQMSALVHDIHRKEGEQPEPKRHGAAKEDASTGGGRSKKVADTHEDSSIQAHHAGDKNGRNKKAGAEGKGKGKGREDGGGQQRRERDDADAEDGSFKVDGINFQDEDSEMTFEPPGPDTVATICYTSGTTGLPKGAILTHGNFMSVAGSFIYLAEKKAFFETSPGHRYLSFLPLAHVFERIVSVALLMSRCTIIFYRGNPKELLSDLEVSKPHYFVGVPRVFNSIRAKIEEAVEQEGAVSRFVFRRAMGLCKVLKFAMLRSLVGRLVFKKIRQKFGGHIQHMLSGSAPLSPETAEFFEICFECRVYEGYGQTETTAGNVTTTPNSREKGVIGIPFPCNRVKLVDAPDADAFARDGKGEILLQGPSVFQGYFKNKEQTEQAFYQPPHAQGVGKAGSDERWIRTGDIGEITEEGNIRVIGRCKETFKLSQGEYIVPDKIERGLLGVAGVEDAMILGLPHMDYLVCICVCKRGNEEMAREGIEQRCRELVEKRHLIKIEAPKKFIFTEERFTIENECLTPTGKKVRPAIQKKYLREINKAYGLEQAPNGP